MLAYALSAQHLSLANIRGATMFTQRFACRTAQENGDFAEAFWLCSQCSDSMNSLRQLRVSTQLTQTIQDLHDETTMRLHNALQVSCTDFKPEPYSKVMRSSRGQSYALPPQHSCHFPSLLWLQNCVQHDIDGLASFCCCCCISLQCHVRIT